MKEYKICSRCIMDTTSDPHLILDENGVCNYCHSYDKRVMKRDKGSIDEIVAQIKENGKNKKYDCILGLSGGVDSSYMAYIAHMYGLRVLAVHVDAGWNSEIAVQNIRNICEKLNYDLHTVVVDWNTMKEVQRAFMFSGLVNLDVPQDHVFVAAVYNMAKKFHINYILNGTNLATEGILSTAWQYSATDVCHIKDVCKKNGRGHIDFSKFPHFTFFDKHFMFPRILRLKTVFLLEYVPYTKKDALELLEREFGWKYYGGKHYESRLTKFLQECYFPQRYGWDKRRDHLASLVVSGEKSREEALLEIAQPIAPDDEIEKDKEYVLKKLEIKKEEFEQIIAAPWKTEHNYKSQEPYEEVLRRIKRIIKYQPK